jgi:hypothetical protein
MPMRICRQSRPGRVDKDRLARCGLAPKAIPLRCDCCATVCRDFIIGWDLLHAEWVGLCAVRSEEGWVMSSYARYCQDQATACARRARLASSPEIAGHESGLTATLFPLHDKPAAYPTEYAKRAGELIARSARSLHRLRQKN